MSEKNSEKKSQTDWEKLAKMTDEEIDTSDIPPLDEKFFTDAKLRTLKDKVSILINADQEISDWYESQNDEAKKSNKHCSAHLCRGSSQRNSSLN